MAHFTEPIQAAFGQWLHGYYRTIFPTNQFVREYAERADTHGFAKCAVWAPGRMIDQVSEMMEAWRKNDTSGEARATPMLPILIAAMSKEFMPAPQDYARALADPFDVVLPGDPLGRVFKMQAIPCDVRVQIAVAAPDVETAKSLAGQLHLWANRTENRRMQVDYSLAGIKDTWPVVLELPDLQAIPVPPAEGVKNLTIMTVDIQMRATVPVLRHPVGAEPNDGLGEGTGIDPHGYPVVVRAEGTNGPDEQYLPVTTWVEGVSDE